MMRVTKSLFIFCALFSFPVLAQTSATVREYCSDPVKYVCGESPAISEMTHPESNLNCDEGLSSTLNVNSCVPGAMAYRPDDYVDMLALREDEGLKSLGIDRAELKRRYKDIQQIMERTIAQTVSDPVLSAQLREAVYRPYLLTSHELDLSWGTSQPGEFRYQMFGEDQEWKREQVTEFAQACEGNAVKRNAFAHIEDAEAWIFICPAMFFPKPGESTQNTLLGITSVLMHELGHTMDFDFFPDLFTETLECMGSRFIVEGLSDAFFDKQKREVSADRWGALAFANYIKSLEIDSDEAISMIRIGMRGRCGTRIDKTHPVGNSRVEHMTRVQPMLEVAGCLDVESAPKPICELSF